MSSAGLSRRRAAGPSTSQTSMDDDGDTNRSTRRPTEQDSSSGGAASHAGSALEGGRKIAFDPRDMDRDADEEGKLGGKVPRLTLMEEVLLLGLKDKQGYLSFWNDNISYALRGCILIELALRRRIALVKDSNRSYQLITERIVEVIDDRQTGETILDEALKMIKSQEHDRLGINSWVDLMSGETWNVMKIGYQLKQVRERLAKGLVDKGVLRTEKRNFLLFDMATHPVADARVKESIVTRAVSILTSTTSAIPPSALDVEGTQCRVLRAVCLVCAAYSASVLDNAFGRLEYEEREAAFQRADDILGEFAIWPFGAGAGDMGAGFGAGGAAGAEMEARKRRKRQAAIASGGSRMGQEGRASVMGLLEGVRKEMRGQDDFGFELIAGVLEVLSKLDSLL
ncbi:Golgi phosphoprotein 3-domain-containing protein [Collybia nuda]|uniref:Golgi phosphoprotein 3-domain-containing protein n=1 Tax=Collybia nuda TaxID=64659 RepID=A0A9P5XRY3_9AGAR|nr:Golgi phosphoprotein 3-domain-containing protein [Collybia nuda]